MLNSKKYTHPKTLYLPLLFWLFGFCAYAHQNTIEYEPALLGKRDSLIINYQKLYKKAIVEKDTLNQIKSLKSLGDFLSEAMNYPQAIDYYSEALFLSEEKGLLKEKSELLSKQGNLYFRFGDIETAGQYFHEAHRIIKQGVQHDKTPRIALLHSYRNLSELARRNKNYTLAFSYIDSCYVLSKSLQLQKVEIANIYRMEASMYSLVDSLNKALDIVLPLEHLFDSLAQTPTYEANDPGTHILVLSLMGRIYMLQGKNKLALEYFQKSLLLIRRINDKLDHQFYILSNIAELYNLEHEYEKAYHYLKEAWKYSEENLKTTSKRNKGLIKIRNGYRDKLNQKEKELMAQNLVLAEKEKAILSFRILLLLILSIVVVILFIAWSRIARNRQTLLKEKAKQTQNQLEHKNKELASYALQLMERDDLLDRFTNYLKKDVDSEAKSLKLTRKQLQSNAWEEFEKRFVEINQGFYERLSAQYPDLTMGDLRYCALLKLNLRGKEISKLLGITEKSVHMARYRIRKKFSMETDANLVEFLNRV